MLRAFIGMWFVLSVSMFFINCGDPKPTEQTTEQTAEKPTETGGNDGGTTDNTTTDNTTTDDTTTPDDTTTDNTTTDETAPQCDPDPGYAKVQAVWDAACSCHTSGAAGGLSLKDSTPATLVDKASSAGKVYVKAGDVAGSYIVDKIENVSGITGGKMPPQGNLTDEQLKTVKAWICNGAK